MYLSLQDLYRPEKSAMWKNKAPETDAPSYDPARAASPKADSSSESRTMKERENPTAAAQSLRPALSSDSAPSRLGPGLRIKGEVTGTDDLLVDGSVEGTIQLDGRKLTVGPGAKIAADIQAAEIVVYGEVKGDLHARDRIEIKKDGAVLGELATSRIMIEDGAYFKGSIEIDRQTAAIIERPERLTRGPGLRTEGENGAKVMPIPMGGTPSLHPPSFQKPSEKSAG
jgi:cytoskeletal protein CcmA (bactofilin family)